MGSPGDQGATTWGLEHLVLAADQILDVVEITDLGYRYLYVNAAYERLFGYTREEAIGRTPGDLLRGGEHTDEFYADILKAIEDGGVWRGVMRGRAKDGSRTQVEAVINAVRNDAGAITHYVAVKRDIQRQRRDIEARLEHAERLASLGTLAAGVGHELNNPLSYCVANVEFILERLREHADPELLAAATETREGLDRMAQVVSDVTELSRADADPTAETVDVDTAARLALSMTGHQTEHRAKVSSHLEADPGARARISEGRLTQVLVNLLVNAAHSLDESAPMGNITLRTKSVDEHVTIEVSDDGRGISAEHLPPIFDPFFTTRASAGGTGLGLAIAHRIVTACGGTLTADSRVGHGTTFRIRLARTADGPLRPERRGRQQLAGTRLLVIDDDELVVRALQRGLARARVTTATSADEALGTLARGHGFDCILCDLMMPNVSGAEFYERLCRRDPDAAKRVVFMTGGAFSERTRTFAKAMAGRVLRKPFSITELRQAIDALAHEASGSQPDS